MKFTDSAFTLIEQHNLDREEIVGTGRGGCVLKSDVVAYMKELKERQVVNVGDHVKFRFAGSIRIGEVIGIEETGFVVRHGTIEYPCLTLDRNKLNYIYHTV